MHLWHWYQSSNLLSDKTQFVRICSSWQMKLVALEVLLNTESLRGRARWNMNLKCFWNTDEFLPFSWSVDGLTYWIMTNVGAALCFLSAKCIFLSHGTLSVRLYSNNRCAACVLGKMSTRAELLGRFCIEDGAQNAGLPISRTVGTPVLNGACCAYSDFANWISPLPFFRSCWTNSDRCTFSGGGEKKKEMTTSLSARCWQMGKVKWGGHGDDSEGWRVRGRSCSANRGAGSRTDGFDCASRRTWRWREQRG